MTTLRRFAWALGVNVRAVPWLYGVRYSLTHPREVGGVILRTARAFARERAA